MGRPAAVLPFGLGLDRATGAALVDPTRASDVRNVLLYDGIAEVRKGMQSFQGLTLTGLGVLDMSEVAHIAMGLNGTVLTNYAMAYANASKKLQLFNGTGGLYTFTGTDWHTFSNAPISLNFFSAEIDGRLFIAHDPYSGSIRGSQAPTRSVLSGVLTTLQANLDGAGVADVAFNGVCTHLGYLFGWGYGTASDTVRPEVLRVSLPGQPSVFKPEHYFLVGSRGQRILACVPVGSELLAFKARSVYRIIGSSRANFGVVPVDREFGLAGARLAAVLGNVCYFWSEHGPRMTTGGPTVDISLPLNLEAPEPADLVAMGALTDGFAVALLEKQQVKFHFGRRTYTLHLRDPQNPRWSYDELSVAVRSGGRGVRSDGTSRITTLYGQQTGPRVMEAHKTTLDHDALFGAQIKTVAIAPAGRRGECVFPAVYLTLTHTMACFLRLTPYVDGVARDARVIGFAAQAARTSVVREVAFSERLLDAGAVDQARLFLRGTWFSLKIETLIDIGGNNLQPGIAAGDMLFEEIAVEYEEVTETRAAE